MLILAGITPWVGSAGDAYGNALAETTIGLYRSECTADSSAFRAARSPRWPAWKDHRRLGALVPHRALMHRLGLRPPAEADAEYWDSQH